MERDKSVVRSYLIPGQMWPAELCWLYDTFAESKHHAEIGVLCGKSLFATAGGMSSATIYAVDKEGTPEHDAFPDIDWYRTVRDATFDAAARLNPTVRIVPLLNGSLDAARQLCREGIQLDSVFIDASHEYADVLADIQEWLPLVRPGGIISGHDYSTRHPGVMDAINELLPEFALITDTRIWLAQKL